MYDYLLVGAGLFNAVFAHVASSKGRKCFVIDKREHVGGNCYTYVEDGIVVHKYGAHIFRTSDKKVWDYINEFAEFNNFVNSPIAKYKDEIYNLPFNMNTFHELWGISTPAEAKGIIKKQSRNEGTITNLEGHAISLVGRDIYEKLIKGYTEKQWGRPASELPPSIMRRIPVRYTYDNNYYTDRFQGIPVNGYTPIIEKMLKNADVELGADFNDRRSIYGNKAKNILFSGTIDSYFDYCYGELEYRSLRFETQKFDIDNYQGVAVVNYTDSETPYTRSIEHKHFEFGMQPSTIVSWEYPEKWEKGVDAYYPINDDKNNALYRKYSELAKVEKNIHFVGRLGSYTYTDMQDTIKNALMTAERFLK